MRFYLCEAPRFLKTEVGWWLSGGKGKRELLFNGYRISALKDEKVLHGRIYLILPKGLP